MIQNTVDITCDLWDLVHILNLNVCEARESDAFYNIQSIIFHCESEHKQMRASIPGGSAISFSSPDAMFEEYASALSHAGFVVLAEQVRGAEKKIDSFLQVEDVMEDELLGSFQKMMSKKH